MASKKKPMTMKRYDEIKAALAAAKIESYELESYVMIKDLKYLRHIGRIPLTDDEILSMVNDKNKKTKYESLLGEIREKEVKKQEAQPTKIVINK
jgi:hypothetical protein